MTDCPTPWKMVWTTRANANMVAHHGKAAQKGGQVRPYHCECGQWHLTSMSRKAAKAVKRRKRLA